MSLALINTGDILQQQYLDSVRHRAKRVWRIIDWQDVEPHLILMLHSRCGSLGPSCRGRCNLALLAVTNGQFAQDLTFPPLLAIAHHQDYIHSLLCQRHNGWHLQCQRRERSDKAAAVMLGLPSAP